MPADGYEREALMPPTGFADALIHVSARMGGIEQALRGVVTHEKLMATWNDLRRDVGGMVRDNEIHVRGMIDAADARAEKRAQESQAAQDRRQAELLTSLNGLMNAKVDEAVAKKMAERDEAEAKARLAVENRAKDTVRGWKMLFTGGGAILGGAVAILALFIAKMTLGWSPFG